MRNLETTQDVQRLVTSYAAETEDGRMFMIHNFADEDFYMIMRDDDGDLTRLGRFDSLEAAQNHAMLMMKGRLDA